MAGACWVIVERRDDGIRRVSLETLGRAAALGMDAVAVLVGDGAEAAAGAVAPFAARVLVVSHPALADYSAETWARVLADMATKRSPRAILAGATPLGRDLCARLAARLRTGYAADVVDLSLGADGDLVAVRPVLGGRAFAEVAFRGDGPRMATVRPNSFPVPPGGGPGAVERVDVATDPTPSRARVAGRLPGTTARADLAEADAIVAGGRGLGGPGGFAAVECLAEALDAAVGASRATVDAGWRDHASQVGKSGRTVSPKLYVALGISGAVHHRMGMDTARTVVVVNSDPAAPFFKHADYGIVGDLFRIAPALAEEIRRIRSDRP